MTNFLPEVQVGPLGGIFLYLMIAIVAIGLLFSVSLGGALIWALGWLVLLVVSFVLIRGLLRLIFGGRGL